MTYFVMMVTGQIEAGKYEGHDNLYCRYAFSCGDDWKVVRGVEEGITQMSTASSTAAESSSLAVWNFPIDVTFKSTGAHGCTHCWLLPAAAPSLRCLDHRTLG